MSRSESLPSEGDALGSPRKPVDLREPREPRRASHAG